MVKIKSTTKLKQAAKNPIPLLQYYYASRVYVHELKNEKQEFEKTRKRERDSQNFHSVS